VPAVYPWSASYVIQIRAEVWQSTKWSLTCHSGKNLIFTLVNGRMGSNQVGYSFFGQIWTLKRDMAVQGVSFKPRSQIGILDTEKSAGSENSGFTVHLWMHYSTEQKKRFANISFSYCTSITLRSFLTVTTSISWHSPFKDCLCFQMRKDWLTWTIICQLPSGFNSVVFNSTGSLQYIKLTVHLFNATLIQSHCCINKTWNMRPKHASYVVKSLNRPCNSHSRPNS
jgi:hypothetical protein